MSHWGSKLWVSLLLASRLAHASEPTASHTTPQLIAPTPELLPAWGRQPTAAASEAGWLSVYTDPVRRVMGRLIDADGAASGAPFLIGDRRAISARVAFDGTQFIVAWLDVANDDTRGLCVQRVDSQGALVGPLEQLAPFADQREPSLTLASGPEGVVIVLCGADDQGSTCRAWPALPAGLGSPKVMATDGTVIARDSAFSGSQLLVVLETLDDGLQLLRAAPDGDFLDDAPLPLNSGAQLEAAPAVAATSAGFAVVWADEQSERLSTVDLAGVATTAPAALVDGNTLDSPQLLALPDGFLVVGREAQDCDSCADKSLIRRYSSEWVLQAGPLVMADDLSFWRASLAPSNGDLLTLWETPQREIVSIHSDPNDIALPPDRTLVSVMAPSQGNVLSAPGPGGWLVAWSEQRFVRARLLDEAGLPRGEVFTIGAAGAASQDSRSFVAEVSGRPDGWLVIWWGDDPIAQAVAVDAAGAIGKQVQLDYYGRFQAVPVSNGWTVAYNQADVVHNTNAVVTRHLSLNGELSDAVVLSEPSLSQLPFDIALSNDGYRVWWKAGISLAAVDVSAGGTTDVMLPPYQAYDWTTLSAVVNPSGSSLMWLTNLGAHHLATTARDSTTVLDNVGTAELVRVAGTTAAVWRQYGDANPTEIGLLHDDGELVVVDSVDDAPAPSLSEAAGDDMLLTFVRSEEIDGSIYLRAYSSLVTVTDDALGGAGGAGGAGGDDAGGVGGERDDVPMGGVAGSDSAPPAGETNTAGSTSGGQNADPNGGVEATGNPSRTSKGCGCRAAGEPANPATPLAIALLAAAVLRRRERAGPP